MGFKLKGIAAAIGAIGALSAGQATAAGFQLLEQNASGLGNAYAGTAAIAQDASTIFYNPAGMSLLKGRDLTISVNAIRPSAEFSGSVFAPAPIVAAAGFNTGGDAGDWAFVPDLYYAHRITPAVSLGLGISVPFGLKTEYDANWMGRTLGILSELKTIDINPTISFKANDQLSFGLGFSAQKADAELTQAAALTNPFGPIPVAKVEGDDWGYGWNIGVLYQATPSTRIGAAYRSEVKFKIEGTFSTPVPVPVALPATADLKLPGVFTAGVVHQLNDKWELLADVAWTDWSVFDRLTVNSVFVPGGIVSTTNESWEDTWRFAFGANYKYSDQWKIRLGIAYDQTPVRDEFRTVRVPDNDRTWLAVGFQYKPTPQGALDVGYAHLFVKNGSICYNLAGTPCLPAGAATLRGEYDNSVDIIGVQYSHSF